MLNYFVETLRKYLFDPNSPMRNEEIFEPVCRFVASYASADEAAQSRARYDLKPIDMNRVGSVAADFVYTLASGPNGVCMIYAVPILCCCSITLIAMGVQRYWRI